MKINILSFCFLFIFSVGFSQTYNGTIIRVIDGDTFAFQTTEGSLTVRMDGIDSPERNQPFGIESTDFMKQYLHKEATLKANGVDRYGRTLGVLYVDRKDINLLCIKGGFAWHYKQYSKDVQYSQAEEYARKNKLGLWALQNPIPPWDWRKGN